MESQFRARETMPSRPAATLHASAASHLGMSAMDPRKTVDNQGTDPNKGLNTRTFLISVVVALFVLLLVLFFVARRSGSKMTPPRDTRQTSLGHAPLAPELAVARS